MLAEEEILLYSSEKSDRLWWQWSSPGQHLILLPELE